MAKVTKKKKKEAEESAPESAEAAPEEVKESPEPVKAKAEAAPEKAEAPETILLIAPSNDAASKVPVTLETAQVIRDMCKRINVFTNDRDGKLYVKPVAAKAAPVEAKAAGVTYPSGVYLQRHAENNHAKYQPADPLTASPLVEGDKSAKLSANFRFGEFFPHDYKYTGARVHPDLIMALESIRSRAGAALNITSGYRPPEYNEGVGGAKLSTHMDGLAADIYCKGLSTEALYDICNSVIGNGGGVGYYPDQGFIHVDVRGSFKRW